MARLVGMVLDAEQVVAEAVDEARGLEDSDRVAGVGCEEVAELERDVRSPVPRSAAVKELP